VPDVALVPDVPLVADVPEVPLVPDVPDVPLVDPTAIPTCTVLNTTEGAAGV
jgi:hypothetical protein